MIRRLRSGIITENGRITAISADNILVRCGDEKDAITVTREEWTNTKYSIDAETQEISETVAGSFKQYPLKTAWADYHS